jgi:hypothetical protein
MVINKLNIFHLSNFNLKKDNHLFHLNLIGDTCMINMFIELETVVSGNIEKILLNKKMIDYVVTIEEINDTSEYSFSKQIKYGCFVNFLEKVEHIFIPNKNLKEVCEILKINKEEQEKNI